MSWLYVAATILLGVYGQVVLKWQIGDAGAFPATFGGKVEFLLRLFLNPWVLSAFAGAFLAALTWMAAMTRLELSRMYPFISLSFAFILVASAVFFGEALTVAKIIGIVLILAGLIVGSQA